MKTTAIIVRAGRTFNHPHEQYSNLRPEVELHATLDEGEDASAATRTLQAQAEGLVEDHKRALLKSIEELHDLTEAQAEWAGLARQIQGAQERLTELRRTNPKLAAQLELGAGGEPAGPPDND